MARTVWPTWTAERVAELGRSEVGGRDLDHGEIGGGVLLDGRGVERPAILELDRQRSAASDHMIVGQDEAGRGEDDPGPDAAVAAGVRGDRDDRLLSGRDDRVSSVAGAAEAVAEVVRLAFAVLVVTAVAAGADAGTRVTTANVDAEATTAERTAARSNVRAVEGCGSVSIAWISIVGSGSRSGPAWSDATVDRPACRSGYAGWPIRRSSEPWLRTGSAGATNARPAARPARSRPPHPRSPAGWRSGRRNTAACAG